jgi:cell division protein FtsW
LKRNPPDLFLFMVVLTLVVIGLVMVSSAGAPEALNNGWSVFHFGLKQLLFAGIGLFLMLIMMKVPYQALKRTTIPVAVASIFFLILVLVVAEVTKGSRRWIDLGIFPFQPSEFAKLAMIMFLAHYYAEIKKGIGNFFIGILLPGVYVAIICLLILLEPDLGTTIVIFGTFSMMLFVGGARITHLSVLGLVMIVVSAFEIKMKAYRFERLIAFLNPWRDPQGTGWQIIQSLYALGSGGPFGLGLGMGRQKFNYLPEAHTDYIFSILGEELGLLGTMTVIILFFFLAWRGYKIAVSAKDAYARMLAAGITSYLIFQAIINIGVVTSSLPVTGVPLPFLSYGGSSLLVSMFSVGILLNISKNTESS